MCGIVGYVGFRDAAELLVNGLRRLEYRGYDRLGRGHARSRRNPGRQIGPGGSMRSLSGWPASQRSARPALDTRAGRPTVAATDVNAHPHLGGNGAVAVVHNGVIENFRSLKQRLQTEGYQFRSATDTEVIAHLVDSCLEKQLAAETDAGANVDPTEPLVQAVRAALQQLHGTYGLAIVFRDYPDLIVAARLGSPLVVGVGNEKTSRPAIHRPWQARPTRSSICTITRLP